MPATMNAVLLLGHGGFEQLVYRSGVQIPAPAPDEVLVQVRAAGVNNTDVNMRVGWYSKSVTGGIESGGAFGPSSVPAHDAGWTGDMVAFPLIQGADVCGVVTATGSSVPASRIGERVLVDPVLRNRPVPGGSKTLYLGSDCNGGFAEYVCVHLRLLGCTIPEPEVFPNLVGYIEHRQIEAVVARIYPLREIAEAQRDFLSKRHTGKIVLQP
jgi:NADPH:quinone reductase-like Zn-dependent oxidoreductase